MTGKGLSSLALMGLCALLLAAGCSNTAGRSPGETERLRLLNSVEPTLVHYVSSHQRMRVWVLVDEAGTFRTRVCTDYKETGSRVWRNSCRKTAPGPVQVVRMGRTGEMVRFDKTLSNTGIARAEATGLEQRLDQLLNAEVKIIDLDTVPLEPIED